MRSFHFPRIVIAFVVVGIISTSLLINFSSQRTELRSNAQSANVQVSCSQNGKVQFAISFTNPESFPVNLLADILIDTQTISRTYLNVTPGQTRTDLISTNLTALPNTGDVVFSWFPENNPADSNDTTASFNQITCNPTTPMPTPTPMTATDTTDNSILAVTPLPPQPEAKPQPFYQPFIDGLATGIQTLVYNFFRFLSAFS